jgi:hypothetical protein
MSPPGHTTPHAPQFWAFAVVSTHCDPHHESPVGQQTPTLVSVSPGGQAQVPDTQARGVGQRTPQAPQLFASLVMSEHSPPHAVCPIGQHTPFEPTCPDGQHTPFEPICPDGHRHDPATHDSPAPQATPHPPQFCGSVWASTQRLPQWVK